MSIIKRKPSGAQSQDQHNSLYQVSYLEIDERNCDQRVDNFLMSYLKSVPRSHIYRIIRQGQVRVNKKRVKPTYRLQLRDIVRIPPVQQNKHGRRPCAVPDAVLAQLAESTIFEDDCIWAINKVPGLPVHAGTGTHFGVIDGLRQLRPDLKYLELVHRLDQETSGCLLLAKQRTALTQLHQLIKLGQVEKQYLVLLKGHLPQDSIVINKPLLSNQLQSGERMVVVDPKGKTAETHLQLLERYVNSSWAKVRLITGRKHQIRVHAAAIGHPVVGDRKYGDKAFNQMMEQYGIKRLFLHAHSIRFELERRYEITAEPPDKVTESLRRLAK